MRLHVWDDRRWRAEDDDGALICEGGWSWNARTMVAAASVTDSGGTLRPEPAIRRRVHDLFSRAVVQMVSAAEVGR